MKKLMQLSFIPRSADFALLVLRFWLGLTLLLNHGWDKAIHFSHWTDIFAQGEMAPKFMSAGLAVGLVVFAEVIAAAALAVGVATRFAALVVTIEMAVAFFGFHHHSLAMGPASGELAFMYLGGALTVLLAGGGRFVLCKVTNDVSGPTN